MPLFIFVVLSSCKLILKLMANDFILKGEFQFFRSSLYPFCLIVCSSSSPSHRYTTKTNYAYDFKSWILAGRLFGDSSHPQQQKQPLKSSLLQTIVNHYNTTPYTLKNDDTHMYYNFISKIIETETYSANI